MNRFVSTCALFGLTLALLGVFSGCAGLSHKTSDMALQDSSIAINQIFLVADTSISMSDERKTLKEIDFLRLFINLMPEGIYGAGFITFDGEASTLQSLRPFNRSGLLGCVDRIDQYSGETRMELGFKQICEELEDAAGTTAIVLVSDGNAKEPNAAYFAARELVKTHQGNICIHTVSVDADQKGVSLLYRLSSLTGCGSYHSVDSLPDSESMGDFVRYVFSGACPKAEEEKIEEAKPKDSDNDGIPDDKDECADTPEGAEVDSRGCWVLKNVQFDYNSAVIKPAHFEALDKVAAVLTKNAGVKIRIDGHTDWIGSDAFNQTLSEKRANAVKEYLVTKGISEARLQTKGFGEKQPIRLNDTEDNRKLNRRVELSVVE